MLYIIVNVGRANQVSRQRKYNRHAANNSEYIKNVPFKYKTVIAKCRNGETSK